MKIVADKAIPFLEGVFEPYAEVVYRDGASFTREDVRDADALITRTRTVCDAALLEGSSVRIIASATIGLDHIDQPWCAAHGIAVRNAPGCNAGGVLEYVAAAVYGTAARRGVSLDGLTIGIVGVGNVGKRVAALFGKLGFRVLLNDPPRAAAEGGDAFCDLDTLLAESDIVTMHVPLDAVTRGMADASFFSKMKKATVFGNGPMFINAARGEVVCEQAMLSALPSLGAAVLDTWNHEPGISRELLGRVDIATPHIAGYSYQGKQNGTAAAVKAVAEVLGIPQLLDFYPENGDPAKNPVHICIDGKNQAEIASLLRNIYPIFNDDSRLRSEPDRFEELRKHYDYRAEFTYE